jgi:hypothetical protein
VPRARCRPPVAFFCCSPAQRRPCSRAATPIAGRSNRPHVLPPGVPPERIAALRRAFMAALTDKDLLAEAAKMRLDVGALSGAELMEKS